MKALTGSKKSFLLRLEEKILDQLRATAEEKGMPLSQLLREVLQDYLDDEPKTESVRTKPEAKEVKPWWL